ncbi:uncharacterized protein LOC144617989 [Crassostrea virginica]
MAHWASEYNFDVFPVDKCPLSKQDWDKRSNELNCSKTHGYHCLPNKHLTSLIEFCYPGGLRLPSVNECVINNINNIHSYKFYANSKDNNNIKNNNAKKTCENDKFNFFSGNCLELAARGFLNQVPCNLTFSSGCPDKFFYSPELYKYPACLEINTELQCFNADVACIYSRSKERKRNMQINTTTENTIEIVTDNQTCDDKNTLIMIQKKLYSFNQGRDSHSYQNENGSKHNTTIRFRLKSD